MKELSSVFVARRAFRILAILLVVSSMQGCSLIYKTTGDILIHFSEDELTPWMIADEDVGMSCALGESMTPLLMAFGEVGAHPQKLGVMTYTTASVCAEQKALEEELRYSRALQAGNVTEARDARSNQKRYHALAAMRQHTAYELLVGQYRRMEDDTCPRLRSDFDELVWLVGLISGVQGVLNDGAADGFVGVPRNVPAQVGRGAQCLDNDKWWGAPEGLRGALWSTLPALAPEDADPWAMLEEAAEQGFDNGVRLGSALHAQSAWTQGDEARLREVIRDFAAWDGEPDEQYRFLDTVALYMITGLSDRLWTEATGQRTPFDRLGEFWDDEDEEDDLDIEGLL